MVGFKNFDYLAQEDEKFKDRICKHLQPLGRKQVQKQYSEIQKGLQRLPPNSKTVLLLPRT
jgi:hypothetical protein